MAFLESLDIPLESYLKKYLTKKYGNKHIITRRLWLGKYLIAILDKTYRKRKKEINKTSYYTVYIPSSITKEVGYDISATKLKYLSEMIHKVFLNDLYSYIKVSVGSNLNFINDKNNSINKQNVLQAIFQFLKYYSINDSELNSESIYRTFSRHKKKDTTH